MILETYQEQQAIVQPDPPGQSFATVGTVYEDGIALIFNGAETESLKHYKCNTAVRFAAGQRVRIIEDSGTYVVEYPVGAPAQSIYADSAARAAYASEAGYAELRETMRTLCFPTAPRALCLSGLQGTANGPNSPAPLSNQFLGGSYGYFD